MAEKGHRVQASPVQTHPVQAAPVQAAPVQATPVRPNFYSKASRPQSSRQSTDCQCTYYERFRLLDVEERPRDPITRRFEWAWARLS